jgi:hypothetical protein
MDFNIRTDMKKQAPSGACILMAFMEITFRLLHKGSGIHSEHIHDKPMAIAWVHHGVWTVLF